ncbi:MAG: xanthine dehydrogenase family protein molybdopterin-binding subunit [Acidimicrobiia bacterium]
MTVTAETAVANMGRSVLRFEDRPILTGETRYTDDLQIPGALSLAVLRSPYARARIRSIDTSAAAGVPGVVAVLTGAELAAEWARPMPLLFVPPGVEVRDPIHGPAAVTTANYVGEAVAVVVAESRELGVDALELIEVDYEPLPAAVDLEEAYHDRVVIHEELGTNRAYTFPILIDEAAVDAAFAAAAHTVKQRHLQQRVLPAAMEPRATCVVPDPLTDGYTVYSSTQMVHLLRTLLSQTTGVPEQKLRVIAPAVGGGFGSKLQVYPEDMFCLALARKLRRPVRWVEERSVNGVATVHGRGQIQDVELAADADGKLTAVRVHLIADMGAYNRLFTPAIPVIGGAFYHGCYDVRNYSVTITSVYTNLPPTDAYRGAGRPEATYAIERTLDALAAQMGMDPAEIRRRNFIAPFDNGHTTVCMIELDSGDYAPALEKALAIAGYEQLRKEQAERRAGGSHLQLGIGIASPVEICGYAPSKLMAAGGARFSMWGSSTVKLLPTGKVIVTTGSHPHGQSHVTAWRQIVSDQLGVPMEDIEILANDTMLVPFGNMTGGSRSLAVEGSALAVTCEKVVNKARTLAAHLFEAAEDDVEFAGGAFSVKGVPSRTLQLTDLAYTASFETQHLPDGMEANLGAETCWDPPNFTFPFGSRVVVVEVDTETGGVEILRFVAVDDCGNQLNPMIVDGQVHGGLVQGIGQALFEHAAYDEHGNPLAASLADYLMPSAAEVPSFVVGSTVTPSPSNPLGAKGVGESGVMGAAPAVISAVVDALAPLGVTNITMPATPEKVWRAIEAARSRAAGARR